MSVKHIVKAGECIASIAFAYGLFPDTVWDHPDNAALREQRKTPNILRPGDQVTIPDKRVRQEVCATGKRHVFRRRGVPEKFRACLSWDGQPRPGIAYQLIIDGVVQAGTTDAEGRIEHWIPPAARDGLLMVDDEGSHEEYELTFGGIDPVDTDNGVRGRLRALGLLGSSETDAAVRIAVRKFQALQGLLTTGEVDQKTRDELARACGL